MKDKMARTDAATLDCPCLAWVRRGHFDPLIRIELTINRLTILTIIVRDDTKTLNGTKFDSDLTPIAQYS